MSNQRVPSVPLITCDPYFSVWSPADALYEEDTCHWTSAPKKIRGYITVDGNLYRFMGKGGEPVLAQKSLRVDATTTLYTFEGAGVELQVEFFTPLLLEEFDLVSRPCSYVDYAVRSVDGAAHTGQVEFYLDSGICYNGESPKPMAGGQHAMEGFDAAWMGRRRQAPLCHSGDLITIHWGYLYVAAAKGSGTQTACELEEMGAGTRLCARYAFDTGAGPQHSSYVVAYDDIASINYFGSICKGWWARNGANILDAVGEALAQHDALKDRCAAFDATVRAQAEETAGADYADLCSLAYRQVVAAHKLIAGPDGEPVFISKECRSNGCSATSDITYPSSPLFFLYAPKYVKAMMLPILKFAQMPVWEYDFAPHDVGRYPYLTGQVYGAANAKCFEGDRSDTVYPPYYLYPRGSDAYLLEMQMPVEECGNMLVMAAAVTLAEQNADFALPYFGLWDKWANYLLQHGADPGEQLCTDDFAGHLAHNVNLAAKAVMGIEAYSILLRYAGREEESAAWHQKAQAMAKDWEARAVVGGHTSLTFGNADNWSLKYNLVWDILFGSGLFSSALMEAEVDLYLEKRNEYGVPLDNRATYSKSDWILWAAALTEDNAKTRALIADVAHYTHRTPDRVPFADWYDTISAKAIPFQNRTVQGELFMPLLKARMKKDDPR